MISLVEKAARIAVLAHLNQVRKSDNSPYVVHPIMCAQILIRYDFSDIVVSSALVHDVLEDTDYGKEKLKEKLGEEVLSIVEKVSEEKNLEWEKRKYKYAEVIKNASEDVKAVSIADKIHNLKSMLSEYERIGDNLWDVFARGKDKQLWFAELMLDAFSNWEHPIVFDFEKKVSDFKKII